MLAISVLREAMKRARRRCPREAFHDTQVARLVRVRQSEPIVLTDRDSMRVFALLEKPPQPTAALIRAARAWVFMKRSQLWRTAETICPRGSRLDACRPAATRRRARSPTPVCRAERNGGRLYSPTDLPDAASSSTCRESSGHVPGKADTRAMAQNSLIRLANLSAPAGTRTRTKAKHKP